MKPRVLHIITRLIVGGAQWNTLYTCRSLREQGAFEAAVLSGPADGDEGELYSKAADFGIDVQIIKHLVRRISPANDVRALVEMVRFIRGGNYQIVHTHSSKAGILGRLAAWMAGVPIRVHTVHGWSFHDEMSSLERHKSLVLERMVAPITDAFIVVTETDRVKGRDAKIGKESQYALIRSGIEFARFNGGSLDKDGMRSELGLRKDRFVVGSMGRLTHQKSPLDFVRLARKLSREVDNVEFIYLGDGSLRGDFEKLSADLDMSDRIHLLGMRGDVDRIVGCLDVYVQTSRWEGLPRAFLEATASGVPVVTTGVDGALEFFQDGFNGFILPPGEIDLMAARVKRLLMDKKLRLKFVNRARDRMGEEFSVDSMVSKISDLYGDLIRRKINNHSGVQVAGSFLL